MYRFPSGLHKASAGIPTTIIVPGESWDSRPHTSKLVQGRARTARKKGCHHRPTAKVESKRSPMDTYDSIVTVMVAHRVHGRTTRER